MSVARQAEPVAQQCRVERRFAGIGVAHRGMVEEIGKREPGLVARRLESGVKLLAQRGMERAVDEIVRLLHADLATRLGEVACVA